MPICRTDRWPGSPCTAAAFSPKYAPWADVQALLTGAFSGGDADLHARLVAAFRSNVYWQQYSQCHWATARACGNVTCAEKEGRG